MNTDLGYYNRRLLSLSQDLARLLQHAQSVWRDYLRLCNNLGIEVNAAVSRTVLARLDDLAREAQQFDLCAQSPVTWATYLDYCELFRMHVRDLANVATTHDWQSPGYECTTRPHFFHTADHGYRGMLGYRRVHHPFLTLLERYYLGELGYPPDSGLACHLTSSGMGAFTVVENWLVRDRLRAGDTLAYMSSTYFEARDQLSKLKGFRITGVDVGTSADVVEYVRAHRPGAFFVEPVNNEGTTTLIDIRRLVADLASLPLHDDFHLVIDTSMSAGGEGRLFDIEGVRENPHLHVVQVESLLKYRQYGLDRVNSGVVVLDSQFARQIFVQRERCGAFLPDIQSFEMLAFTARGHDERMVRIKRNVEHFCRELAKANSEEMTEQMTIGTPIATGHPNHAVYQSYRYLGGVVPLSLRDRLDIDGLLRVITATLDRCRDEGVVLHHSTSFGFNATHIGIAATGGAHLTQPFLRVSVGEDPVENIGRIAANLAAVLHDHLTRQTYEPAPVRG